MVNSGITDIDLIVANTDAQALETSNAPYKIQLGEKLTKGLGAGMKPEIGQQSAIESYDTIKEVLDGADIVFVSSGLGGGTGTGGGVGWSGVHPRAGGGGPFASVPAPHQGRLNGGFPGAFRQATTGGDQ